MTETVAGTSTIGINIFRQGFPLADTTKGDSSSKMSEDDILKKLWDVTTATDASGNVITIPQDKSSGPLVRLPENSTDPIQELLSTGLDFDSAKNIYKLKPGYGVVFQAQQGTGNKDSSTRYVTYYCYFKEKESASDTKGNLWVAYITGKNRAPLMFDVQDDRDVIFTCTGKSAGGDLAIKSIDTTNFNLEATGSGYNTNVELKNTAFNLSTDDKMEGKAYVKPFFCFKGKEIA